MKTEKNIEIHDTAFITSTLRSFNEGLSQDNFAKLWCTPKAEEWTHEFLEQVSSEETHAHCLRNGYFLDSIKKLVNNQDIEVLINFGSGFSMYPFLLNEKLIHIEIDKPEVIDYKREKVKNWQKNNVLPKRDIHFISVDFSENYKEGLLSEILLIKKHKSCFILIEGVLFFLNKEEADHLFSFFNSIQNTGDYIGSASFQDDLRETLAFKKLLGYLNKKVSRKNMNTYQTIKDSYYQSNKDYQLIDHQDYFSLSKTYKNAIKQNKELILNENFYLLKKV